MVSPGNANGEIQGDGVGRADGNACEDRAMEQVITHPHSSFHGQGVQLLGGVALAEPKHTAPWKAWQEELGPPALPAGFRNPLPMAQFLNPQMGFVLFSDCQRLRALGVRINGQSSQQEPIS